MVDNLLSRIEELKRRKGAVILAHYYTLPEVQAVADFLGDSLALSIEAQKVEARTILFAGVHFMAETAKVLCPDKKVLIPVPEASCSLADGCEAEAFRRFRARYPGHTVVSYVNTSVEIKAQTDVCCTSSNALKVVESIPAEQPILFAPDRNLGAYVQKLTGRTNMVLWDGACHVHEEFSLEKLLALREEHPGAEVVAHPECRAYITAVADFVGSTAAILDYCGRSDAQEFIVVTEAGILAEMRDFDRAVRVAMEYVDAHPGTLLVVTADHETGGLTLPSGNADFTKSESGVLYKYGSKSHTAVMVPVYLYGTGAERINGVMENSDLANRLMEILELE